MNQPPVDFIRVEADAHREFGASCLEACGLEDAQAEHIAARLTWADLRGIHSHGAPLLERYVRDLRAGTVNPAPSMHVVREEDAMIVVDGDGGYGYVPTASVTEKIIGKARDRGVAAGSLLHIGHYGSASHYTSMCAEEGCIGFSVQGLVSGFDFPDMPIALWGSRPISFAIPAGDRPPIIVDGCANLFREKDLDLFERVPSAFFMSLGFTVVAKLLGDGLSGQMRRYTREADPAWPAAGIGAFVLAINVEHFTSASEFGGVVDRFVGEMCTQMRPMPGTHRALLPGMLEAERQQTYQREGIPLATETCRLLEEIARPLGVSVPWPALGADGTPVAHRQGRLSETAVDLADSARPHHTSLSFRPALSEHSALVAQIYNDVSAWLHDVKGIRGQWARQVPEPEVHEWIDSGELHIVQGQTEPVGVLRISTDGGDMWTDRRGEALYVSGLAVLRRFSGKQLGYQILRKVAELAHGQGKEFVRLDCMAANDRLRQYYVDGGFESLGEHPTKRWFARFEKRIR